jgi:hypothetical protein
MAKPILIAVVIAASLMQLSTGSLFDVEQAKSPSAPSNSASPSNEPKVYFLSKDAVVGNDLFAYILKKMPDICELSNKMKAYSSSFSTYGQRVIKEFVDNFEETIKAELQATEEPHVVNKKKSKQGFKSLGMENFHKVLDIFGLNVSNDSKDICNFKSKLKETLAHMDSEEMITVRMLFDKLKKQMEAKMPYVFSQTFAKNFEQINKLTMSDPDAIKKIGPLLSEFFNNATGL